jgi:hypothetical protein
MALKKLDTDARIRKANALKDDDDEDDTEVMEPEAILVPVDDMGVGVFAPEAGLDSRYMFAYSYVYIYVYVYMYKLPQKRDLILGIRM